MALLLAVAAVACSVFVWRSVVGPVELIHAIYDGDTARVRRLVASGVDVNGSKPDGFTPLMRAVSCPHPDPEIIRFLLAHGADVSQRDRNGRTAMDYARSTETEGLLQKGGGGR